jgi:hypothetical protein
MNSNIGIIEISTLIANTLAIPTEQLIELIRSKLTEEEINKSSDNHKDKINEIKNLLESDRDINNFGNSLKNHHYYQNQQHKHSRIEGRQSI